ncbi:MAG: chromosome segregation protein SMC [candidate division GAL15 bacterium]
MHLKRLELWGFKTFADRTELFFGPGITAIVGPNGSGKSNLADAIRWVLGETSWRALRSQRTEDVIFAGTRNRRAHGMAEVHLTVDNEDGFLPLAFTEVTITRRATRAGESEFFLNRTPCRLRDIQTLFLGTGLGGRAYAMIGQGEVEAVLDASPAERRALLEEAAGLSRYKRRAGEAARRLEHARHNLTRVRDRLAELEARAAELAEQAERARLYREAQDRLRQAELLLHMEEFRRARSQLHRAAAQLQAARERRSQAQAELGRTREELEGARHRAQQAHKLLEEVQRALVRATEEAALAQQGARLVEQQLLANAQMHSRIREELDRVVCERDTAAQTLARLQEELDRHQQELKDCAGRMQEVHAQLVAAQEKSHLARAAAEDAQAEVIELEHARAQAQAVQQAVRARLQTLGSREQALEGQLRRLQAEGEELVALRASLRTEEEGLVDQLTSQQANLQALQEKLNQLAEHRAGLEQQCRHIQVRREQVRARLAVLEEAQAQLVGYEAGAREVLIAQRERPGQFEGVRGALVDYLDVEAPYRRALQAALEDRLFSLVADSWETARRVAQELRAQPASFVVLEAVRTQPVRRQAPTEVGGVVGWAFELLRCPPLVQGVVSAALQDTLVVEDLDVALRLWSSGWRGRLVSLNGEVLTPDGLLAVRRNGASGPLGRVQELAALRSTLAELEREEQELEGCARALETQQEEVRQEQNEVQGRAEQLQGRLARLREEVSRTEAKLAALPRAAEEVELELSQVRQQLQELHRELAWAEDLERLGFALQEARLRLEQARRHQQEAEAASAHLLDQLASVRVQQGELQARCQAVRGRWEELQRQHESASAREAALRAELQAQQAEQARLEDLLREAQQRTAQARGQLEALRARAEEASRVREAEQAAAAQLSSRAAAAEQSLQAAEEEAHRLDLRAAQLAAELGALQRRLREDYQADPEALQAQLPQRLDRDALTKEAQSLRQLLSDFGPVNLQALDEYAQVRARRELLASQVQDVEQAATLVSELASRLEGVLRCRFRKTFEGVNGHFQDCFRRLFGGGRAQLERVVAEDGEEGVEIVAQPPGKKVRSLGALSGGERVMVALALVFALLRTHPSPFCVFDEIEPALDEANTQRVVGLLRELAQHSQVVLITHNKATMEAADVLYGVTTQEPGVSSVVSVRLVPRELFAVR